MRNAQLTDRETEVFEHLAKGNTSKEIAGSLNISVHTVNNHRKRICRKLAVHSTAELVSAAARHFMAGPAAEAPPAAPLAAAMHYNG